MQLDLFAAWKRSRYTDPQGILIGTAYVSIDLIRNLRARRYILRVTRNGVVRVTIPRGGSATYALEFARKQSGWIQKQLLQRAKQSQNQVWMEGTEILFRGKTVRLITETVEEVKTVRFADHVLTVSSAMADLRPAVEAYLWSLAEKELGPRTLQLASAHQLVVRRVAVRNQRTRWGSCSPNATISLNWRLIQAPDEVRDYLILHELMHLREMNHSHKFWRLVEAACPNYRQAERWLDLHAHLLR